LLTHFLRETPRTRTLVFSRTKHGADKIVKRLMKEGLHASAIHSDKSQNARSRALAQFKKKKKSVLVATDIASRGLDIDNVSHVINYDLPDAPEIYIHRIGRTARAGAEGVAVSFCAGDERRMLKQIERLTKTSITVEPTISGFEPTETIKNEQKNSRGGNKNRSSYKPKRRKPKSKATGSNDKSPYQGKRSDTKSYRKKSKSGGNSKPSSGKPSNGKRHRATTNK